MVRAQREAQLEPPRRLASAARRTVGAGQGPSGARRTVMPAIDVEHRGGVVDGAGDRTARPDEHAVVQAEGVLDAPARRFEAEEAGRTTRGCGSSRRRRCPARWGSCRPQPPRPAPPLDPPAVTSEVPGVAGRRVNVGLGDGQRAELARGRLAEDDEAAAPQPRDHRVVERREEALEGARPEARERAAREVEVLDADGDAEERRQIRARACAAARRPRAPREAPDREAPGRTP